MDAWIDPTTGDYAIEEGAPIRDAAAGLSNAIYLRLMTPLGSYWPDKDFGSRLHLLAREKDKNRVAVLARQYAEQALAPIVADRRARSIEVTAHQPGKGRMTLSIVVIAASGERLTFEHPVTVI